jgi:hypothetical protein
MIRALAIVGALLIVARPAVAQSRFELGASVTWTAGFDAGGSDALETRNPATGSSPLTLFDTSSRQESVVGGAATAAFFVTSRLAVEGFAEYGRPTLHVTISNDFEGATGTAAGSRLSSLVFGASVLYHFSAGRLAPFVEGGAGRLRQLDEDAVVLVTSTEVHAGGGMKYRLSRRFSLRAEAVASSRARSVAFDDRRHTVPVVSGGLVFRF